MPSGTRIFICDPICALPYGHTAPALVRLASAFAQRGFQAIPVAAKDLPLAGPGYDEILKFYTYLYQDFHPLVGWPSLPPFRRRRKDFERAALWRIKKLAGIDLFERVARSDAQRLIRDFGIGPDDLVFFPNVDYYGGLAFLHTLREIPASSRPKVHLRFIGVMERYTRYTRDPVGVLMRLRRELVLDDTTVDVSAESPVYADFLSGRFHIDVDCTVYPTSKSVLPQPPSEPFLVLSAGTGRGEKGFFRLFDIAKEYLLRFPDDPVSFRVQGLPPGEMNEHHGYVSQLSALPNVELLPAILSDEKLERQFAECHLAILPYEREPYRHRGTGILMDAFEYGRYAAVAAGTGFEPLVEVMPSAALCDTNSDFCDFINRTFASPLSIRRAETAATAESFRALGFGSLDHILQALR